MLGCSLATLSCVFILSVVQSFLILPCFLFTRVHLSALWPRSWTSVMFPDKPQYILVGLMLLSCILPVADIRFLFIFIKTLSDRLPVKTEEMKQSEPRASPDHALFRHDSQTFLFFSIHTYRSSCMPVYKCMYMYALYLLLFRSRKADHVCL